MSGFVDVELIAEAVKDKITADYNAKLLKIDAMKNDNITLKKIQTTGKNINWLGVNEKDAQGYNPFFVIDLMSHGSIEALGGVGGADIELGIAITLKDPGDDTGKRRMLRYLLGLERMFQEGMRILNLAVSSSVHLPYVPKTDFKDPQITLLTWGLGLGFKIG